jgi:pimeloyl-ACP methyl ester carboxylesterase
MLVASACTQDAPDNGTYCAPLCSTSGTAVTGDSGVVVGANGFDAGVTTGSPDAGSIVVVDAAVAPRDGGNSSVADGSAILGSSDASGPDAGSADASSTSDGSVGTDAGTGSTLPAVTDYAKPGPFKTTTQANVGPGNNYTIYRPDPLGANGFVHSPIIFGPGILTDASFYSAFLTHLASHGFVTICVNSMGGGPGDPGNLSDMTMGLDWLIMQNSQSGIYQGKLAVDRAIGMGYSIGATASVELSSHKAIATTVVIHGHNTKGDPHGPVLMITGTNDVIGDMRMTLSTLEEAPAVLVALPIGHLDVLDELAMLTTITPTARYIAPITAWLRYWINGDQNAKSFFAGSDCGMCKSPWITPEPNAKWKALML